MTSPLAKNVFCHAFTRMPSLEQKANIKGANFFHLDEDFQSAYIGEVAPLDQIADAHELVEHPAKPGRVIVAI